MGFRASWTSQPGGKPRSRISTGRLAAVADYREGACRCRNHLARSPALFDPGLVRAHAEVSMFGDSHTLRSCCAGASGVLLAVVLLRWAYVPPPPEFELVPVTGRATCGGHPLAGMSIIFLLTDPRGYAASGSVEADGSFRMESVNRLGGEGIVTGTYRIYFYPDSPDARESVDPKYQDPLNSDLLVHIRPDWNDVSVSLPARGRGPTLARHQ